jgi:hypothetical protein
MLSRIGDPGVGQARRLNRALGITDPQTAQEERAQIARQQLLDASRKIENA